MGQLRAVGEEQPVHQCIDRDDDVRDIARTGEVEGARERGAGQQGVLGKPDENDDGGRNRPQVDDPGRLRLAAEDEVDGGEESDHRDDVALDREVSKKVERIDRCTPSGKDELADDRAENCEPGQEPQKSGELFRRGSPI